MELREIWLRFVSWLRKQLPPSHSDYERPQLSDDGLIIHDQTPAADKSPLQAVAVRGKPEVEKFQEIGRAHV